MRDAWSAAATPPNEFYLPHEAFKLGLGHGPLLVYLYLIYRKSLKHGADKMSCAVIGKAVGPIQGKVCERRSVTPRSRWISTKRPWLTGEVFDAVFPVPVEVFQLGLQPGELLVYIYLHYQKGVRSGQCWPSYATIGAAVGMSRKTVQKHIGSLINKGLIQAEETMIRRKDGRRCNGSLLYTVKPIQQILREREEELLAELKQVEVQRKWERLCQKRDRPRSAL